MPPVVQAPEWITLAPPRLGAPEAKVAVRVKIASERVQNPTWVAALSTGFAVVDKEQSTVSLFDAAGTQIAAIGRRGAGPGEFSEGLNQAVVLNNRLLVPDNGQRRLNVVDVAQRKWVEAVAFPQTSQFPIWWVAAPPNDLLELTLSSSSDGPTLAVVSWTGSVFRDIMPIQVRDPATAATWFGAMPMLANGPRPGTFSLVTQGDGTVAVHGLSGQPAIRYRLRSAEAKRFTEGERRFFKNLIEPAAVARQAKRIDKILNRVPEGSRTEVKTMAGLGGMGGMVPLIGEHYPFFTDARFDPEAKLLWIARPLTAGEIEQSKLEAGWEDVRRIAATWDAYEFDGRFAMRATLPTGTFITDIRGGRFYGLQIDGKGERSVTVLEVAKP